MTWPLTTTRSIPTAPHGSATSSQPATSPLATLMSDQLSMFDLMTSPDTASATGLPESQAGVSPCALPDGPTTASAGPAPARVSRFRALDSGRVMPTNDTSGPLFTASSPSATLQLYLENRLRAAMAGSGSPLFALTWSEWDMPSGPPICRLRASGHRISGQDCGSWLKAWPTPDAGVHNTGDTMWQERRERIKAKGINGNGFGLTLGMASQLASWPTASARDWKSSASNQHGVNARPLNEVARLASWATPQAHDAMHPNGRGNEMADRHHRPHSLPNQAILGPTASGSPAATGGRGQLNPAFSLWLQGYPIAWLNCAPQGTRLSRKSRPSSSGRQSYYDHPRDH